MATEEFWDDNYYDHPPLLNEDISRTEDLLNVKLPTQLIQLLKKQNGGYTRGFCYPTTKKTSWSEDHVPLQTLFGIVTDNSISTPLNLCDTPDYINEWGLPKNIILISGDGPWWIALDYRESSFPTVIWIDLDVDEDVQIASSFEKFINGLILESEFQG